MRIFIPIIVVFATIGCRENDPPPTHFEDLGTEGSPLLPTSPVWKKAAIATGQAEWHPFRDPTIEPEPDHEDEAEEERDAAAPATGGGEIETEIRELIGEFNDLVGDASVDEILEYFVAEQTEALKPIVESALATTKTLEEIQGEIDGKLPDAGDRTKNAISAILADMSLALRISTVTVKSDTEVGVSVDGGVIAHDFRFVIVDEEWYIEAGEADGFGELGSALENGLQYYREMLQSVRSDAASAENRLKELEATVAAARERAHDAPAEHEGTHAEDADGGTGG